MPIRLTLPRVSKIDKRSISEADKKAFLKLGYTESPNRRYGKSVVIKRLSPWEIFEEEVRRFFQYSLELTDVDGGFGFRLGDYQIDAMGGISKHLIVVECKAAQEPKTKSLRSLIRNLRDRRRALLAAARRRFGDRYSHLHLIIALRGHQPSTGDLEYARQNNITIWTEAYWDSIRALYLTIGNRAKFYILKELGGDPPLIQGDRRAHFVFPAIRSQRSGFELFALFIPAKILLEIAYVLRIESGQKAAYQRYLDKSRLYKIAAFLEKGKSFKNSIVVALDATARFERFRRIASAQGGDNAGASIGTIRIPRRYASAWIIDGQHRLYGFARVDSLAIVDEALPVIALKSASSAEDAETFLDINSNQKPVDPSLLWQLFGQLDPQSQRGVISLLVQHLALRKTGVFANRIHIPGVSPRSRRHYRIYQSNFCGTISDHLVQGRKRGYPLVLADDAPVTKRQQAAKNAATVLSIYFSTLEAWARRARKTKWIGGFFFTNNGANVMVRVLVQILKHNKGRVGASDLRPYSRPIIGYLKAHAGEIDAMRRRTSSEGTREAEARSIIKAVSLAISGFGRDYLADQGALSDPVQKIKDLEDKFRAVIEERLQQVSPRWWRQNVPEDVRVAAELRREKAEATPWMAPKRYPSVYYLSFADYRKIISQNNNWNQAFEPVFKDREALNVFLKRLEDIRNALMHGRSLSDIQVDTLNLVWKMFNRMDGKLAVGASKLRDAAATLPV